MIYEYKYCRIKQTRHGTMMYNKNDVFIGKCLELYGEWAWDELELTKQYATGIVLDIGANIGTHSLVYAEYASRVIAFEPVLGIFNVLCANIALNCAENISPVHLAVGSENGRCRMPLPDYNSANNFGGFSVGLDGVVGLLVTVDSINLPNVSLIKIDVEGYEREVLRGAADTILRCKPALYIENDREENTRDLCDCIESLGYSCQWHEVPLFNPGNVLSNKENVFPDVFSRNMLCLPKGGV